MGKRRSYPLSGHPELTLSVGRGAPTEGGARYTDGSPVVFGPFGGDQMLPVETRLQAFANAYHARSWWRKLLNADIDKKTRAALNEHFPRPAGG